MKKVISFLAGDGGNFHFVKPVINYFEEKYDVRVYNSVNSMEEIQYILNTSDIVWYEWGNGPVVTGSKLKGRAKTICRIHRYEILGGEIKSVNWKNIDHVIFVNEEFHSLFKELVEKNIDEVSSVHVIPNPVNDPGTYIEKKKGYNIAYVSRFHADKNPGLMIQVLKKLTEYDPAFRIYMAGGIKDVQLYLYCMHLINEMGLKNNFIYDGVVNNIPQWLEDKNYFLSTSIVEAHPVAVTEAMMQGIKPVLHNSYGRLGHVFDPHFLFNTPEEAVKIITEPEYSSASYREMALSRFSAGVVLSEITKLTDSLIPSEKSAHNITAKEDLSNAPFITVAIVTYNRSNYLPDAINSVLQQEGNFEILIVDDCSNDNTKDVVESFKDNRIRYRRNENNLGRPGARNRCVQEARGDYILWLGDDDMIVPGMLREYSSIIINDPMVDIVYGNVQAYDQETGEDLALFSAADYSLSNADLLSNLISGSGLTDGGSMIRKELYNKYGGYDPEYLRAQDNELWTRIGPNAKFHKVNRTIYRYRKHSNNVSFGTFVDHSYESKTIRKILNRYALKKIFGNIPETIAYYNTAAGLFNFSDYYNAARMLKIAGVNTSAAYSELYFTCLINMGLTDEAEKELHSIDNTIPGIDEVVSGTRKKIQFLRDFRKKLGAAYEKNDFPAIKNIIQFYLSNAGNVYDTVFALGKMLAAVNEKSMAYGYLKLALMFNPENTECFNLLMEVSATAKDNQDAENMRNRLLQQLPLYDGKLSEEKVNPDESSPLISVIITTYNRKDKLPAAVKSVLAQEYKNLELIIVNDAGEDVTDIINAFNDSGIKLINHKANKGLPAARNTGIKAAKGEYIALLDDDDIYYPDHLSVVLPYLKEYDVVYTDAVRSTIKKINGIEKETARTVPYSIDYDRNKLLIANIAPVNCFVFKKSLTESAGLFDESLPALEDWEFWIRLSGKAEFKHVKQNTVQVNWFDDGSTMTTSRQNEFGKARDCIYKKYAEQIKSVSGKEKIVAEFNAIWRNDFKQEPIVSIIALTYNQLDYTKAFVESVFHNTSLPFELILIDNNSSDSTGEYLTQLAASKNNVKVFLNKENAGFPGGINQGIKASSGKYILVANNDILVTENWLNRMVEAAENNPSVGIVGPVSNSVSGVQVDKDAKYSTIEEMFEYAAKVSTANKGKSFIFPRIAFLCTLVKKEVIDKIGGLDERFSPGNFEDDDFCLRAQMAGYKALVLQDVFIHHFGSKSFTAEGTKNYIDRLEKNKQIFVNKWGADPEEIWLKGKQVNNRKLLYPLNTNPFMEYFERAAIHIEEKEYDTAEVMLKKALSVIGEKGNYPVTEDDIHNLLLNIETLKMCEL